jgi:hypothetical protein
MENTLHNVLAMFNTNKEQIFNYNIFLENALKKGLVHLWFLVAENNDVTLRKITNASRHIEITF